MTSPGPLRIAIDCSHYAIPGGIRTCIENEVRALAAIAPEHEYLLTTRMLGRLAELPQLPPGARSRTIAVRAPRRLLSWLENAIGWPPIEFWTGPIDIFHGTHFSLPAARAARLVLTVHDVTYLRHPEYYADRKGNEYGYKRLLPRSLGRAASVIASSHSTRRDIIELCGVPPDRIWVVALGTDPRFRPATAEMCRPVVARLAIDRPYAIYPVGTADIRKNLPRALEAFVQAFPDRGDRPLLVLTGARALPESLSLLAARLGLSGDIRLCSVGYPDDLAALLSGARWGMYLSLYEGFGLPLLEAMACGLPLVASRVSSIPEVTGEAALLVDPTSVGEIAAAMLRLDRDADLRRTLAARGEERACSPAFTWERAARQTLAVYRGDRAAFDAEPQPLGSPPDRAISTPPDRAATTIP